MGEEKTRKVDTKEFEIPETVFVRDIENRVFQGIVLQCLAKVEGINLVEGNFIDSILGRGNVEGGVKGIYSEQDNKTHTVDIKVEVNICYGISIPNKAEEIQTKIAEEITKMTGLHVSRVHVVFKNIVSPAQMKKTLGPTAPLPLESSLEDEYNDEF
ncbi:Asp23/Gls24 family envelope stress response protein [Parachlamydia sp. AcF125]|uniref:Asp23/Gls24 family envelope stress response protein n=1 Tax=Parachlamydia sp. AcF125 TaxID=2795736 RepID=UPI001BC9C605|nr:Asp23/Gls24 family envelope stress response protein [Parachlamydia sp. AcF125]MBS4168803.1 hypothetical protein [Parachlamydia sp. AcF125]